MRHRHNLYLWKVSEMNKAKISGQDECVYSANALVIEFILVHMYSNLGDLGEVLSQQLVPNARMEGLQASEERLSTVNKHLYKL